LASAGLASRPDADLQIEPVRIVFTGVWKEPTCTYSTVLAQVPALSARYRRRFLSEVAKMTAPEVTRELETEAQAEIPLSGKEVRSLGRVTLFLRAKDFVVVGFENQPTDDLHRKEHLRYDEYLRLRHRHPLLAFFAPGENTLLGMETDQSDRFVHVNEEQLAGWADGCLLDWIHHSTGQIGQVLQAVEHYLGRAA
jgi:hypothetical protein